MGVAGVRCCLGLVPSRLLEHHFVAQGWCFVTAAKFKLESRSQWGKQYRCVTGCSFSAGRLWCWKYGLPNFANQQVSSFDYLLLVEKKLVTGNVVFHSFFFKCIDPLHIKEAKHKHTHLSILSTHFWMIELRLKGCWDSLGCVWWSWNSAHPLICGFQSTLQTSFPISVFPPFPQDFKHHCTDGDNGSTEALSNSTKTTQQVIGRDADKAQCS